MKYQDYFASNFKIDSEVILPVPTTTKAILADPLK